MGLQGRQAWHGGSRRQGSAACLQQVFVVSRLLVVCADAVVCWLLQLSRCRYDAQKAWMMHWSLPSFPGVSTAAEGDQAGMFMMLTALTVLSSLLDSCRPAWPCTSCCTSAGIAVQTATCDPAGSCALMRPTWLAHRVPCVPVASWFTACACCKSTHSWHEQQARLARHHLTAMYITPSVCVRSSPACAAPLDRASVRSGAQDPCCQLQLPADCG